MRKIGFESYLALRRGLAWRKTNTEIVPDYDRTYIRLYGTTVLTFDSTRKNIIVSLGGYDTATTISRLNDIMYYLYRDHVVSQLGGYYHANGILFFNSWRVTPTYWACFNNVKSLTYPNETVLTLNSIERQDVKEGMDFYGL